MRIHQLSPLIANQIAAGEVIERPASVVKELLENSLDAGADAISIEIGYGGLNQIKISDNGTGIVAEDLPLAVAAHATSKINTLNDLYAIDSMGFRGEALASIASVAKVSISSKPSKQDKAMMLHTQGGEICISPCARTQGTTIDVVDLFFNAPVRKRFLKSEKLEFQAIETVVKRFALSAPNIALTLKHNGVLIFSLPAASSEQTQLTRMARILGNAFMKEAFYLDVERGAMRLYGWISGVGFQRSQNDRQWVYVNQRMVKDKLINHAIKQAYEGLLHPGRFPACALYLLINHAEVDVNVHPTKHEVRFQQPRLVHDFFTSQLSTVLQLGVVTKEKIKYEEMDSSRDTSIEIYEPSPPALHEGFKSDRLEIDLPWVILNKSYILVFLQNQPYVVNLLALQQQKVYDDLIQSTLPLASRPLLVPVRYSVTGLFDNGRMGLKNILSQLGILVDLSETDQFFIRTIPVMIPYLDLHVFFQALADVTTGNLNELMRLASQSQVVDPQLLSPEEKMELHQFLINTNRQEYNKTGLFKALTPEDCRNLVYA